MTIGEFVRAVMRAIIQKLMARDLACAECWHACAMWFHGTGALAARELKWRQDLDLIRLAHGRARWTSREQDVLREVFCRCMIYVDRQASEHCGSEGQIECTGSRITLLANWPTDHFYREWAQLWK